MRWCQPSGGCASDNDDVGVKVPADGKGAGGAAPQSDAIELCLEIGAEGRPWLGTTGVATPEHGADLKMGALACRVTLPKELDCGVCTRLTEALPTEAGAMVSTNTLC